MAALFADRVGPLRLKGTAMQEIQTIRFDGDKLQTVREGEQVWVVLKRACEALGIAEQRQAEKLKELPWACTTLVVAHDSSGRNQELFCLDLDSLPMWLATISIKRVRPEAREKLIHYQRECARVLRDHFFGRRQQAISTDPALVQAVQAIAQAVAELQRGFVELSARVDSLSERTGAGSFITAGEFDQLRTKVRTVSVLEVAAGSQRSRRAAVSSIYAEMRRVAGWGSGGEPWRALPSHRVALAFSVLTRRRETAEKALESSKQLSFEDALGAPHKRAKSLTPIDIASYRRRAKREDAV